MGDGLPVARYELCCLLASLAEGGGWIYFACKCLERALLLEMSVPSLRLGAIASDSTRQDDQRAISSGGLRCAGIEDGSNVRWGELLGLDQISKATITEST